jgi:hypothetical protein
MSNVLVVGFDDFKRLVKDKRIYYFTGEDFFEFNFIADGLIVKSAIPTSTIENPTQFFSNPMFYNAIQLQFRIPNPKSDIEDIDGIRQQVLNPIMPIQAIQTEEVKNTDEQREGVGDLVNE